MNKKISSLTISFILTKAVLFGLFTNLIIDISGTSSVISILIGTILSILVILLGIKLRPLLINNQLFKYLLILLSTVVITLLSFNMLIFATNTFLFESPYWFVIILFLIPLFFISKLNIATIYYTSNIVFVISIILFIISIAGSTGHIEIYNILPINITNYTLQAALILPLLTFLNLYPLIYLDNEFYEPRYIILGSTLALIFTVFTIFKTYTILGIFLTNLYAYPEYMSLMRLNFVFIERFEYIFLMTIIFEFVVLISFHLFSIRPVLKLK